MAVAAVTAPIWLTRMVATGKIRTDWAGKLGCVRAEQPLTKRFPRILLHAVSVGEVNAIERLVDVLAGGAGHGATGQQVDVIVSATTDTGFARASSLFEGRHTVVRFPLDFSFACRRFLDAIQPDVVALVELEVWPQFVKAAEKRDIAIGVINGRLSERSFKRYGRVGALLRRTFSLLDFVGVQDETYAQRFRSLGAQVDCVHVLGTMKWDTAIIRDEVDRADDLAREMGIDRTRPLVVAGSTAPEEHALLVKSVPEDVQLMCVPRKPEWFDAAARALPGCARRSRGDSGSSTGRFLLDTMGELDKAYSLADLVVVGRTFAQYHGSDMMQPIALGKAVIIGPDVSNFQTIANVLLAADGLVQTHRDELQHVIAALLSDRQRRVELADNGRDVIRRHQGATHKYADMILQILRSHQRAHSDA